MNYNEPLKLFSDGETMAIKVDGQSYIFKEPFVKDFNLRRERDYNDIHTFGGDFERIFLPATCSIEISLISSNMEVIENFDFEENIFNKYSVRDLLKKINKKVDKR